MQSSVLGLRNPYTQLKAITWSEENSKETEQKSSDRENQQYCCWYTKLRLMVISSNKLNTIEQIEQ